jgi:hypothetical protein
MTDTLKKLQELTHYDQSQSSPIPLRMSRFNGFPKLLNALGMRTGAEIGVASGWYSQFLCKYVPGLKLYCVDPWKVYADYVEQHDEKGQQVLNANFETAKQRLIGYDVEFIKKFSMDAVKDFADGSLDFVYIDGNHSFQYVVNDIAEWSKKVRVGGIVAGHDFWRSADSKITYVQNLTPDEKIRLCQVPDAVEGWTRAYQIKTWFTVTKDRCPTWFWVKTTNIKH